MDWVLTPINAYIDAVIWIGIAIVSLLLVQETQAIKRHIGLYWGLRFLLFANVFWSVFKVFVASKWHEVPLLYFTEDIFILLFLVFVYWIATHYIKWNA